MNITHLECAACATRHEAQRLHNLCRECGKPLLVRYDLQQAGRTLTKESLGGRRADLWRYREVLPVEQRRKHRFARRRLDTITARQTPREKVGLERALYQRRVAEPNAKFQGTRNGDRSLDGQGVGR